MFFADLLSECKVYVGDMPQKFYTTIGKFLERASLFAEVIKILVYPAIIYTIYLFGKYVNLIVLRIYEKVDVT